MGYVITGDALGTEHRSGTLDNGNPWNVNELVVLDGLQLIRVRMEDFQGPIPQRGDFVAIECTHRFGKFHAVRRVPALEAALASKPAAPVAVAK